MQHQLTFSTRELILLMEACSYASSVGKFDGPEQAALSWVSRVAEGALASAESGSPGVGESWGDYRGVVITEK
jgi:hypothetical protein